MARAAATSRRKGFPYRRVAVASAVVLGLLVASLVLVARLSRSASAQSLTLWRAERGEFVHEVNLRGTLESASNVEIRCRVENQNPAKGSMILELVPEGTYVQPGDLLVRFDSSKLDEDRKERMAYCQQGEADLVRYQGYVDSAKNVLKNYEFGTLVRQRQEYELDIFEAEENLRQASQRLESSRNLYRQGFVTQMQLQADQFAVDRAKVNLNMAEMKLDILNKFTGPRYIRRYQRSVETYKRSLERWQFILQLRRAYLKEVEAQIAKCTIRAPAAGQVVYANQAQSSYGPIVIEEGAYIRYNQPVLHLPDPKRMQVNTTIDESRIALVRPGAKATITLEAMPGQEFTGVVEQVNDLPEPSYYWSPPVQQYKTTIRVDGEPAGLRPGWTAQAMVCVERQPDQLQVPVDAIFENGQRHFCVVRMGDGCQAREVKIGSSNGKTIVICDGLRPGEMVVEGVGSLREQLDLPDPLPEASKGQMVVAVPRRAQGGAGQASSPPRMSGAKEG